MSDLKLTCSYFINKSAFSSLSRSIKHPDNSRLSQLLAGQTQELKQKMLWTVAMVMYIKSHETILRKNTKEQATDFSC